MVALVWIRVTIGRPPRKTNQPNRAAAEACRDFGLLVQDSLRKRISLASKVEGSAIFLRQSRCLRQTIGNKRVESEVEPIESPEAFLARLGEGLTQREGVDAGLEDILKTHILKAQPAQNAVAQAKDARSEERRVGKECRSRRW